MIMDFLGFFNEKRFFVASSSNEAAHPEDGKVFSYGQALLCQVWRKSKVGFQISKNFTDRFKKDDLLAIPFSLLETMTPLLNFIDLTPGIIYNHKKLCSIQDFYRTILGLCNLNVGRLQQQKLI